MCICADPAATKKTTSDHTAALVLAVKGYGDQQVGWLLGHLRGQWDIADNPHEQTVGVVSRLAALQRTWGVAVVVEAVAGFKAVPQMLRAIDPHLRVVEAPAVSDKFVRAQPAAAAWNSGRLLVPIDASWAQPMIQRFQAFTGQDDPEDDEIDACAHGWNALFTPVDTTPIIGGGGIARSANPFG
jgi:predicted phage terminase large subunit-like protein